MALRNLVAKMRNPAAAALRQPSPRVSPPAGARPRTYSSAQNGQHGKGIDLESASEEEVRRQAELLGKEIDETLERLSLNREKVPALWQDIFGSVKLWIGAGTGLELVLYADSRRRRTPEQALEQA